MSTNVHPTAIVHPEATLEDEVELGPYAVVGKGVHLGPRTRLASHAIVEGPTRLGEGNVIFPFAVLGCVAQDKRHAGAPGSLEVGDANVFREHVTVHRGTGGRATVIGHHNLLMAGAHAAHDTVLGSHITLANGVQLAGHAKVGDYATFGGLSGVAQFVKVGESAFVAAGAMCERDVPPFVVVQGDRARVRALNRIGLERRGLDDATIAALSKAYAAIFGGDRPRAQAIAELSPGLRANPFVARLIAALA
ncbi:acyl-ACP--UDP-N-acetylglucosamine O-acyltransferase [Pendulispora albinea]|uniref:Acyl-ACP--UDP-N-acetylglucosamine O-acyltransferase n=1 Tax=Pendulispora albinea TaxID=2741071 RepID=A0ABZ2LPH5_9BACT